MWADEFVSVLGQESATRLSEKLGCEVAYIPLDPTPDCTLAQSIGFNVLLKLSRYADNGRIYIPTSIAKKKRIAQVCRLYDMGLRSTQISRETGIHDRTVRYWRVAYA